MKRIILHIGLPKTGTTSIQEFLAADAPALAREGVLFPVLRTDLRDAGRAAGIGVGWHLALSKFVSQRPKAFAPGEWEAWTEEFARFAADPHLHTLLLSQEGLMHGRNGQGVRALMAALPEGAPEIVLVIRPALGWLTSLYEQLVRSKARIGTTPADFAQAHAYVDQGFTGMIRAVRRRTSGADLRLLSFDALRGGEGLLANFAREIGLSKGAVARAAVARHVNSGLPQDMVAALRACNAAQIDQPAFVAIRGALGRAARQRRGKPARAAIFPADLTAAILNRYEADRTVLKRRFGLELRAETPPPPGEALALTPADWHRLYEEAAPFLDAPGLAAFERVRTA